MNYSYLASLSTQESKMPNQNNDLCESLWIASESYSVSTYETNPAGSIDDMCDDPFAVTHDGDAHHGYPLNGKTEGRRT